jgi:hypothetical protein
MSAIMKQTQPKPSPGMYYIGGPVINLLGEEIGIEAVENGYSVKMVEIYKDDDGDNCRRHRHYVFTDSQEMLKAIDFWTSKQEVGK